MLWSELARRPKRGANVDPHPTSGMIARDTSKGTTSMNPIYKGHQAEYILTLAHARLDPEHHVEDRRRAAETLCRTFGAIALDSNFRKVAAVRDKEFPIMISACCRAVRGPAVLLDPGDGAPRIAPATDGEPVWESLDLAYDPGPKGFIGHDDLDVLKPVYESARTRRNAIEQVAVAIVRMLARQVT